MQLTVITTKKLDEKMKRSLLSQMRVEWRSNLWMIVELAIVGLVVVFVSMILAFFSYTHTNPEGYDLSDIYRGRVNFIKSDADEYIDYSKTPERWQADIDMLARKLRENQYVENVGFGANSLPYNHNFDGNGYSYNDGDTTYQYIGNLRYMDADLIRTIRLTGPHGETTEQLASANERGEYIVCTRNSDSYSCEPEKLLGKDAFVNDDSTKIVHVASVMAYGIARDDYEGILYGCVISSFKKDSEYYAYPSEVVVRVKPGMGRKFMESLNLKDIAQGNVFFNNFTSVDDMRDDAQRNIDNFERNIVICAVFLLVAVFLGFLGSFWFRTQQRVSEIALRKVCGASQWQIFSRLIGEGLMLLVISAIFFSPIYFYIAIYTDIIKEIISTPSESISYIAYAVALIILAVIIIAGIWFPARRAMKVEPASALKDQ